LPVAQDDVVEEWNVDLSRVLEREQHVSISLEVRRRLDHQKPLTRSNQSHCITVSLSLELNDQLAVL